MRKIFSNSFSLYAQEFYKIILLSLLTYVPLLLAHAFIVNYIYEQTLYTDYPNLIGDVANGVFMLIFLTIAQIPFIKYTLLEDEGEDNPLKKALSFSLEKAIPIYIFACLYALLIFIGGLFFVLPGLAVLLLFYFVPYFLTDSVKSFKVAIKKSVSFMKKNFFKTFFLIILLSLTQLFFENVLITLLTFYTDVYFTLLIVKILLLMLLLPLQTIIVTNLYNEWKAV
ncbi:hypothetical protein ACQCVO_23235 [Bacillus infantis]|uniref:hypothetical protein n=1 Tax=Bacillus infantis TaxID=324767 RepID=UPI003CEF05A8